MVKIVICGHGHIASGILSALELLGPQHGISTLEFVQGETKTELDAKVDSLCSSLLVGQDDLVVLCDLKGGSPFQAFALKALGDSRINVVFGVNLPMLIEAVSARDAGSSAEEVVATAVSAGTTFVGSFVPQQHSGGEEDDF